MLNLENKIIRLKNCKSTNTYAKELLTKSKPIEGTVVITDKQTMGRGQFGNSWVSKDYKNLTFSIILKPTFLLPSQQFILSKITAISCVLTLNNFSDQKFLIKWPNDIFYKNNKIAGILIENSISATKIIDTVVGVGININQSNFENNKAATSLYKITKLELDLQSVLSHYLVNFEKLYIMLQNNKIIEINEIYKSLLLGINQKRNYIETFSNKKIIGTIQGVNSIGQLIIDTKDEIKQYNLKEIKWLF